MKKTNIHNKTEAALDSQQVTTGETLGALKEARPVTYVVVRAGFRVSEKEYLTAEDPAAVVEKDFWTKVAKDHSYGEMVEIVRYESKKHRVW